MSSYTFVADRPIEKYRKTDKGMLVAILLMWGLGIFTLYICSPYTSAKSLFNDQFFYLERQLINSAIGFAGLIFFSLLPMDKIRKFLFYFVVGTLILCVLTLVPGLGVVNHGARRWLHIPFIPQFQPSELAKFAVVLFLANLFDKQNDLPEENQERVLPEIVGLVAFVILIFAEKDFSTGMFVFMVGVLMFFAAGAKISWLVPFALLAIPAAFLMISIDPYRIDRVTAFISPEENQLNASYQQMAAERAISAGGFWGQGLGTALSRIKSVPEIQTDYIFVAWAEAFGYLGVIAYFILLIFFAWRAIYISLTTPDRFASYGTMGCTLMIVLQAVLNCAVVSGSVPTTGIPLPFFSSGGSSLIMTLCMCGFILNASHCDAPDDFIYTKKQRTNSDSSEIIDIKSLDGVGK